MVYKDDDLVETVKHYLIHDSEREKIAYNGSLKCRTQYTYKKRLAYLLNYLDFNW